ncbi:MAG: hypothetical protein Fur0021_12280 [Candidatus Promineifilaceae bacterium]
MALKKFSRSIRRFVALAALAVALTVTPLTQSAGYHMDDCVPINPPICPG